MNLTLADQERAYLLELLQTTQTETRHELHYTDTADYKKLLKQQLELIEGLLAKLRDLEDKQVG